jgi:hypothetical protein
VDGRSTEALLELEEFETPPEESLEQLSQEDMARLVYSFRGHPRVTTPTLRYVARSRDGLVPAYVWDEASAMVWILD